MPSSAWQVTFHFMYIASDNHDCSQPEKYATAVTRVDVEQCDRLQQF